MVFLTSPYITVMGQSQYITTGDTTPSTSDGTDFGALTLLGAKATTCSFIIANTGIAPLHLSGSSTIALSVVGVADFKVLTPPVATVDPGSSTTCTIAFQPKAPGQRRVKITLSSEDWLIPSFTFDITGFGLLPTKLAQTITFAPPATLHLAQSPFALSASSSSGLPVTLSLVTPIPSGASLAGNNLSFTGAFTLAAHPTLTNRRYLVASLTWQKLGLATDASYRAGFGPVSTVLMIDPWLPPVTEAPVVTLAQRLGLTGNSFHVSHSSTGSASQGNLPTQLGLSTTNAVSVLAPVTVPANSTKWKTLTFVPATGTFTGIFELTDAIKRTVSFSGVPRQPASASDHLIGDGSFVLPPTSGTEKTTGEVMFTRP
jgi:hypothetical protein